jgi:hypothetical protein
VDPAGEGPPAGELRPVKLARVPAAVLVESDNHVRSLVRELQLIRIGEEEGTTEEHVPQGVLGGIAEITALFRAEQDEVRAAADEAMVAGEEHVDLELLLPIDAAPLLDRLQELLEQADRLCERGTILTLPSSAAVRDLRRSMHRDVMAQLRATPGE